MFIYSVKASTVRFFGVLILSVVTLVTLIALIPAAQPTAVGLRYSPTAEINFSRIRTNEDRVAFLAQFGWEVEAEPKEEVSVTVPAQFDKVFVGYNEIQKQQGLDLTKYRRKTVMRYTYTVKNYPDYEGTVLATLLVYRGRVIGGDLCTEDPQGFVRGFDGKNKLP